MYIIIIPLVNPSTIKVPTGDRAGIPELIVCLFFAIAIFGYSSYKRYQEEKE